MFGGKVRVSGNSILKALELTLPAVLYLVSMYILEMGSSYIRVYMFYPYIYIYINELDVR